LSTNLHALIRYRTIHHCLQRTHRRWTWEALATACGNALREFISSDLPDPSRRSIMYDIQTMRHGKLGYHAPIVYDRRSRSYRYTDPDFSIYDIPLTADDLTELRHALTILQQFRGFPQVNGVEEMVTRLEHSLSVVTSKPGSIIHFDQPHQPSGLQWLPDLYRALYRKLPQKMSYHPFYYDEPYVTVVSPLLLKEYNKRWFLIAWDHERLRTQTFPLDRIRSIAPDAEATFHHLEDFSPDRYFRDIVGVSFYDDQPELLEIQLWVHPDQAPYLHTKPLHHTQKVLEETSEGSVFQYNLIPNFELESQILALGDLAVVRAPESLRQRMAERVRAMAERYSGLESPL
jgi:predicted DNA-binding transcriptional regulator YafY